MKLFASFLALILSQQAVSFAPPLAAVTKPTTSATTTCHFDEGQQKRINFQQGLNSPKIVVATQDRLPPGNKKGIFSLFAQNSAEETEENDVVDDQKIVGRKKRVIVGYKTTMLAYLLSIAVIIKKLGLSPFSAYFLSGHIMTAGVAYILAGAAENDRLGSDTYKRLNIAVSSFGLFGLINQYLMPANRTPAVFISAYLAFINSLKGYGYGVLGWDKKDKDASLVKDMFGLAAGMVKGIFSIPKNMKSFGYLGATGMLGTMKVLKLIEVVKMIRDGVDGQVIATRLSRFVRFAFMAMVFYILKDAADRDRLEGTTFIELNFLSSLCMATMSAYSGFNTRLGGFAAFFSVFSAVNGFTSIQKKRSKA